jgi:hypothetical protein
MKPAFKLPDRKVDEWVSGAGEGPSPAPTPPKVKQARLTIDIDANLHAKFKATCALRGTNMVDEVRGFIEKWIE